MIKPAKAARALDDHKADAASRALFEAQVRGVDFRYSKEDTPLAEARDAIWLAKRALEENNTAQARANLGIARQQLEVYRQVLQENKRLRALLYGVLAKSLGFDSLALVHCVQNVLAYG